MSPLRSPPPRVPRICPHRYTIHPPSPLQLFFSSHIPSHPPILFLPLFFVLSSDPVFLCTLALVHWLCVLFLYYISLFFSHQHLKEHVHSLFQLSFPFLFFFSSCLCHSLSCPVLTFRLFVCYFFSPFCNCCPPIHPSTYFCPWHTPFSKTQTQQKKKKRERGDPGHPSFSDISRAKKIFVRHSTSTESLFSHEETTVVPQQ